MPGNIPVDISDSIQDSKKTKIFGGIKTFIFTNGNAFKKRFEFLHSFVYFFQKRVGNRALVLSQNFSKLFRISFL